MSPSTVRAELAELEAQGLLTHPHTSAGRLPTEEGYRYYANELLTEPEPRPAGLGLELAAPKEIDSALQQTTDLLSDMTRLLALVSAPPLEAATVRHVEVLLLQPTVAMVVVITSTGGVSKRIFTTTRAARLRSGRLGCRVPERERQRAPARDAGAAPAVRRPRAVAA